MYEVIRAVWMTLLIAIPTGYLGSEIAGHTIIRNGNGSTERKLSSVKD